MKQQEENENTNQKSKNVQKNIKMFQEAQAKVMIII